MNVILVRAAELDEGGCCELDGRRAEHIRKILRARPGAVLRVGLVGGRLGRGELLGLEPVRLRCVFDTAPPAGARVALVLGMPRPITLKRLLRQAAELGVERIDLLRAARTEKSYLDSPVLERMEGFLEAGLEQAGDTILPEVRVHRRFRPFVEDVLPGQVSDEPALVAAVGAARPLAEEPSLDRGRVHLAIGPDGGWVPFELERLAAAGFRPVSLGPRVLRTDTAVTWALAQLAMLRKSPKIGD